MGSLEELEFIPKGFIRGRLPQDSQDEVLRLINREWVRDFDSRLFPDYAKRTYFPELAKGLEIRSFYERVLVRAFQLHTHITYDDAQIALRFPGQPELPAHVDHISMPDNGLPKYLGILGIYLSDVRMESGPLIIWPGSQTSVKNLAAKEGWKVIAAGLRPPTTKETGLPILGLAGEAILYHPHMIHGALENTSPNIRYAMFFRLYDERTRS